MDIDVPARGMRSWPNGTALEPGARGSFMRMAFMLSTRADGSRWMDVEGATWSGEASYAGGPLEGKEGTELLE